jgi:DNA polymerase-3 subunit beta
VKFTIQKKELLRVTTIAAGSVAKKSATPALGNVKIDARASVSFSGTDLVTGAHVVADAKVDKPGATLVPATQFLAAVRGLADGEVTVTIDGGRVEMRSGKSKQRVVNSDADDYPTLPKCDDSRLVDVPAATLAGCIATVAHAMSTDESRAHLAGIFLTHKGGKIRAVATNGHTLAQSDAACPVGVEVLIPSQSVSEIRKALAGAETASIATHDGMLFVRVAGTTISAKLTGDTFPAAYEQLIPTKPDHRPIVAREAMLDAVKRVMSTADGDSVFELRLSDGQIALAFHSKDGGEAADVVECDYAGSGIALGIRGAYAILAIAALDSDDIAIEMGNELAPVMFVAAHSRDTIQLVMPSRL